METLKRAMRVLILVFSVGLLNSSCLNPLGGSGSEIPANHRPGDSSALNAAKIEILTGGSQTDVVGSALATPIRVRILNSLAVPVEGEEVSFGAGSGSVSQASVQTDAQGEASITWTLGTVSGSQSLTVSVLNGLVAQTVAAVALAGPPASLEFQTQPVLSDAGSALATSPVVRARDSFGNIATGFSGGVTMSLGVNPTSAVLGGTATVSAVSGVATFSNLTVDRGSLGYRLEAAASSLTVQSDLFNVRCVAILDSITAPTAAYSLRKLRSAYAGSAFRARRSDGTLLDIGFDSVGCEFDKAALLTFAGTGDAFVHTWYDQQNNGKSLVQTTQAAQPRIVASGALESENSRPVVRFRGTEFLPASNALGIAGSGGFAYSFVLRTVSYSNGASNDGSGTYFLDRVTETNPLTSLKASGDKYMLQKRNDANGNLAGVVSTTSISTTAFQRVMFERERGVQFRVYVNGTQEGVLGDSDSNLIPPTPQLGRHSVTPSSYNVGISELIIWANRPSSADRTALESSQSRAY